MLSRGDSSWNIFSAGRALCECFLFQKRRELRPRIAIGCCLWGMGINREHNQQRESSAEWGIAKSSGRSQNLSTKERHLGKSQPCASGAKSHSHAGREFENQLPKSRAFPSLVETLLPAVQGTPGELSQVPRQFVSRTRGTAPHSAAHLIKSSAPPCFLALPLADPTATSETLEILDLLMIKLSDFKILNNSYEAELKRAASLHAGRMRRKSQPCTTDPLASDLQSRR